MIRSNALVPCGVPLDLQWQCVRAAVVCLLLAHAIRADEPAAVRIKIIDGGPAAARVTIVGPDKAVIAPAGVALRSRTSGESYFYADGAFEVVLPGRSRLTFTRGLETTPASLVLGKETTGEVSVTLQPWIDMAARGWYSGDSHVHLQTGGPIAVTPADALVAARAEDLNYVNLCVSNNVGDDIRGAELITGVPHALSTDRHLLVFGEEMRSSIYGHMQFFGIRQLVEPQYTGFDNTPQHHDFPANYVMAAEAVRQGGLVTYGHPMFKDQPNPYGEDLTAGSGAARELPVDAMLGAVQAVDLMCYNSDEPLSAELWYRLLNCGLKLAACAGTDALLDRSTDPMGGERVYVKVDGPLSMSSWLEGLRRGRSFVTNGPMLNLTVADKGLGETHTLDEPGTVQANVTVESRLPVNAVTIIVNGQVAHRRAVAERAKQNDIYVQQFAVELPIERSSWVAVRAEGPDHPEVIDGPVWAHTSPVYVEVAGKAIASGDDAAYFVEWIDGLLRVVAARDRYARPEDRQQVEATFREAQDKFRAMAELPARD